MEDWFFTILVPGNEGEIDDFIGGEGDEEDDKEDEDEEEDDAEARIVDEELLVAPEVAFIAAGCEDEDGKAPLSEFDPFV